MSGSPLSGSLYIVAAPSGAGKTSLVRALLAADPAARVSVSHTTREPRPGERHGVHYHFVPDAEFAAMVAADAFLEHAEVYGRRYGTARDTVLQQLAQGQDVILEIDWQGARQVRARLPAAVGIFILPPSIEVLLERLRGRGTDAPEVIARRMAQAESELSHHDEFDYLIVNEVFDTALADLAAILRSRRLRRAAQLAKHPGLVSGLLAKRPATG